MKTGMNYPGRMTDCNFTLVPCSVVNQLLRSDMQVAEVLK